MRNITRLSEVSDQLPQQCGRYTHFTIDSINSIIYLITDQNQFIGYNPLSKNVKVKIELNSNTNDGIISEGATIVDIQFIPDSESVCMASDKGDILMYNVQSQQMECVGIVGSGITAMSWSPDYELLILATESGTLVQMTKEWDILNEVAINSLLPGGKLTTNIITNSNLPQAQYSQSHFAKSNLDKPKEESINRRGSQQKPQLSWRGDGQYFVCSGFDQDTGRVMLRVWERNLVLHSISETTIIGLECVMGWRPNGSLIAVPNKLEHRHEMAFFERNGLKHGEFTIREKDAEIESIQWSSDSEVLAIMMRVDGGSRSIVQLWHRSNYYWFLKHEIQCQNSNDRFVTIQWDSSPAQILRTLSQNGIYQEYTFVWDYNVSQGSDHSNPSIVVMVDGNNLKMTPFRRLVVPPPMSAYSIQLPSQCASFAFSHTYSLAVAMTNNTLSIYTPATLPPVPVTPNPKPILPNYGVAPVLTASVQVPLEMVRLTNLRQLVWVPKTNTLVAIDSHSKIGQETIVEINFSVNEKDQTIHIDRVHKTTYGGRIIRLCTYFEGESSSDRILFETIEGGVYHYHLLVDSEDTGSCITAFTIDHTPFKFTTPCQWIAASTVGGEESMIGLTDRNKLYINNLMISQDCNNFTLHNKFLLYTTVSHLLRSVPLSLSPSNHINNNNNNNNNTTVGNLAHGGKKAPQYDDSVREVERGSRIVLAVPHDTRVVLQMPRGNLEAIAPRSLTLSTIRELLNEHQYGQAFAIMRRNRIDMNFLYDHNPSEFLKHVNTFIEQVPQIDYLNLFITSLREEDTTKTLFIDLEKSSTSAPPTTTTSTTNSKEKVSKINIICDKLRDALLAKDSIKFNLPILTTYVKKSPPELDQVLRKVQSLRGKETTEHGETIVNRLAEESLDYIVFLVDVNKLYDVALGTYDFELVIMVAQKSQKDPKEYIAFLQELQVMEPNYQHYMIDRHLERWPLALENLSKAGEQYFEQCIELIQQHNLYQQAVNLFKDEKLKRVQEVFGDYLVRYNRYDEAAHLFYQCKNEQKALQAFRDAGVWKMAVMIARKLQLGKEEFDQMCHDMAEIKRRSSKYVESAEIFKLIGDVESAISALCEGGFWLDAYTLALENGAKGVEWSESIIREQLEIQYDQLVEEIQESTKTYQKSCQRMEIVRIIKANQIPIRGSGMGDDTTSMMSGMSGMFSEMSGMSGMSGMSVNSYNTVSSYRSTYSSQTGTFSQATKIRTKKNKDKKPKKTRVSGKEGSAHEEEYLVETVKKLIPSKSKQESVGQLLRGLVLYGMNDKAKNLQQLFKTFIEVVDDGLQIVSASATAIQPENMKEITRVQEIEFNQKEQQMIHHNEILNQQQPIFEKMTINKIIITRDQCQWEINIL